MTYNKNRLAPLGAAPAPYGVTNNSSQRDFLFLLRSLHQSTSLAFLKLIAIANSLALIALKKRWCICSDKIAMNSQVRHFSSFKKFSTLSIFDFEFKLYFLINITN